MILNPCIKFLSYQHKNLEHYDCEIHGKYYGWIDGVDDSTFNRDIAFKELKTLSGIFKI